MKNGRNKFICLIVCVFYVMVLFAVPASANSAQTDWSGRNSSGVMVRDENCPIVVTNEVLTFDIAQFPDYDAYKPEVEELLEYSAQVTAEYTFYNPSDLEITAKLAFPFETGQGYARNYENAYNQSNIDKYGVTVNGETVDKTVRHTLQAGTEFDLSNDLPRIHDEYVSDSFYTPDTLVTVYTYKVDYSTVETTNGMIDFDIYHAFDFNVDKERTRLYCPYMSCYNLQDDGDRRISHRARINTTAVIYAIGEPLSQPLDWTFYEDYKVKDGTEVSGEMYLASTDTMRFEDFALEEREQDSPISEIDWYNIVVCALNSGVENSKSFARSSGRNLNYSGYQDDLLCWYEYEITLQPGETITNTVTVPLYPKVNSIYHPDIFTYNYLLSPAKTWASFGELEIVVNTPYYIISNTLDGFEKNDSGYVMKRTGLPDKEFKFILCESDDPENSRSGMKWSEIKKRSEVMEETTSFVSDYFVYIGIGIAALIVICVIITKKKK